MILTGFVPSGRLEADLIVSDINTRIVRAFQAWSDGSDGTGFTLLRTLHQSEIYSIKI